MPDLKLNPISDIIEAGSNAVEKVAGVFTSNAERDAQRSADEQMALLRAYQAEFNQRENRTRIDAFADAFNRLVRPFIVTIIVFIFVLAYVSPAQFAQIAMAMGSVPNGYWALLSVIIGFYFGGRMQLKSQDFAFKQSQADAVRALIEAKSAFRKLEMDNDEPDRVIGDSTAKGGTVEQKRDQQTNAVIEKFLKVAPDSHAEELQDTKKTMKKQADLSDIDYLKYTP